MKQLAQSDVLNGSYGLELVSAIAVTSGEFRVDVSCQSKQSPPGKVKVELSALRSASPADRNEIDAERIYMEGAQLAFKQEAESKRTAAAKFDASARLWQALGDSYEQGLALHSLAYMEDMLGESQQALTTYQQAAWFAIQQMTKTAKLPRPSTITPGQFRSGIKSGLSRHTAA